MSGLVQPALPRFSGILGAGGGGGGGSGNTVKLPAGENLAAGDIVALNNSGEAVKADPDLALPFLLFGVIGVAKAPATAGNQVTIYSDEIMKIPVSFSAIPVAGDNGKQVFLGTTPGQATLTAPNNGNAVVRLGWLQSADGVDSTPFIMFDSTVIAFDYST